MALKTLKPRIAELKRTVRTETTRMRGSSWMVLRARILRRDCGLCQACKAEQRLTFAEEVDHRVPLWAGGTDDEANLQSLCKPCHDAKSEAERQLRACG